MDHTPSPLDTLRQLKEMLDAGALTLPEFELLKQRLVFDDDALFAATPPPVPPAPDSWPPPVAPAPSAPEPSLPKFEEPAPVVFVPVPPVVGMRESGPVAAAPFAAGPVPAPVPDSVPFAATSGPVSSPQFVPVAAAPTPTPGPMTSWSADEFPESEAPPARNPLMLVLSIGGLLALLGLVVYLSLNRPPSERISSTSLTAADSLAAPVETGPQAEQLPSVVAAPETVRVLPTNPAPPVQPRAAPVVRDSAAAAPPATPADSANSQ